MLDDTSLSAATAAGAAIAEATTTEQWTFVRSWAARFLARGDLQAEQEHLKRLDQSAAALRQAYNPELRVRVETALQTRFELLLESSAGVERAELAAHLLHLAGLRRMTYATVAPAATTGPVPSSGGMSAPAALVGRIPAETVPFRHRAEAVLLDGPSSIQVLTGPTGTGKTQLAAHIARRALRDGSADLVVWVTTASSDALICGYADAAAVTTDYDPGHLERSAEAFRSWLSWTDRRWLVVLDGVPDTANLHGLWPPARPNGRVLVTARRTTSLPDGSGCVEIGSYLPEEAADQLMRELLSHGRRDDPAAVVALAADLRQHPLALSTAAACMAHSGLNSAAYRDRLRRLAAPGGAGPTRDAVTAVWWAAVETADRQCAGLARPVLELAAVLDPHGVPVAVLTSPPALRHLARRGRRQAPEASLPVEERDVLDALDVLYRLRLVERDSDTGHPTVRLSPLVQTAVLRAVPVEARNALALSAADALRAVWREASDQPQSVLCRALRSGADVLTGHAGEALWRPHCHPLLFQVGRNLIDAGLIRAARIRWDWLHARLDQRFGPDHADTLAARGYQARVRGASQDAVGAVASYRNLLHDLERVLGHDNPDVFTVRDNLARWQGVAGDPARAAATYTDLLADRLPVLGPTHPDTLLTRHNIALWRGNAGDAAGAATAYAELLDDMVRTFEANHPAVLEIRDQLTEWRNKAADVAAAAHAPVTTGPRPDQLKPDLWSPPMADGEGRPSEGTPLSAQHLLSEPPRLSRLRSWLTRRGRPADEGPRSSAELRSPITGCHRISVISLKGGTGKTTTAAALGATLAGLRDEPVIAVDASPEGGTLGHRVRRENDSTILDLLAALPELDGHDDIRRFTATGPNGLEILAHDVAPALSTPFGAREYHRIVDALSRTYPIVVTDSGTGLMREAMRGVLALTDQLVVVATASVDGAAVADVTLDWLSHHGHAELAQRALVVLSAVHPRATLVRTDRIIEHFAGRCQGVVTVPFDEHLATGAELDLTQMRAETRRAYTELATLVAERFPRPAADQETRAEPAGATGPAEAVGLPEPTEPGASSEAGEGARSAGPGRPVEPAAFAEPGPPQPPGDAATPPPPPPAGGSGRTPRPPRRARLSVVDDIVRIGTPTTIEFTLAVIDPQGAHMDRTAPVSVLVLATPRSSATLEPSVVSYGTDDARPAQFTFTAWEAGEHRLRFKVYDPEYGKVLQVVETTLPVAVPQPLGGP